VSYNLSCWSCCAFFGESYTKVIFIFLKRKDSVCGDWFNIRIVYLTHVVCLSFIWFWDEKHFSPKQYYYLSLKYRCIVFCEVRNNLKHFFLDEMKASAEKLTDRYFAPLFVFLSIILVVSLSWTMKFVAAADIRPIFTPIFHFFCQQEMDLIL